MADAINASCEPIGSGSKPLRECANGFRVWFRSYLPCQDHIDIIGVALAWRGKQYYGVQALPPPGGVVFGYGLVGRFPIVFGKTNPVGRSVADFVEFKNEAVNKLVAHVEALS